MTGAAYAIDLTSPTVTFDSTPTPDTNHTTADFTFHGVDPTSNAVASGVASLECALDSDPFTSCTSPQEFTGLTEGQHTFEVRATDAVGNVGSSAIYSWTIDTTPPTITSVSNTPDPTDSSSTIDYTLSEAASVTIKLYDTHNNVVRTLVDGETGIDGPNSAQWDLKNDSAVDVPSGSYTYTIDATDVAGNPAVQQTGTVTVERATHLVITSPAVTITAGNTSGSITVERTDEFGNPTTVGDLLLHLGSSSASAGFRDSSDSSDVTTVTIPNGASSATFLYTDTLAGSPTITVADQASGPDVGLSDATQQETVNAAAATHLTLGAPASATAGQQFDVTVTARDQYENVAQAYSGTVLFSSDDANPSLPGDSGLTAGTGTFPVTLTQAGTRTRSVTRRTPRRRR